MEKATKRRISDRNPMDKAIIDHLEKKRDEIDYNNSSVYRVYRLPNLIKSVVQIQVSKILLKVENPMMQQPLMAIPSHMIK